MPAASYIVIDVARPCTLRQICLALASAVLFAGCAHHITVVRPIRSDQQAELNAIVENRETQLTLIGKPDAVDSRDLRVAALNVRFVERDSATSSWRQANWLPEAEAPLSAVQRIEFRSRGRGALNGLAFGAATGAIAGITVGLAAIDSNNHDSFGGNGARALVVGGATVALGLLGTVIGAIVGARTTIDFSDVPPR